MRIDQHMEERKKETVSLNGERLWRIDRELKRLRPVVIKYGCPGSLLCTELRLRQARKILGLRNRLQKSKIPVQD